MRLTAFALLALVSTALVAPPAAAMPNCRDPLAPQPASTPAWGEVVARCAESAVVWAGETADEAGEAAGDAAGAAVGIVLREAQDVRDGCDPEVQTGYWTITDYGGYITIDGHFVWVGGECAGRQLGFGV